MFVSTTLLIAALAQDPPATEAITIEVLRAAAATAGLQLTDDELRQMQRGVVQNLDKYRELRASPLANSVPPALAFTPGPRPARRATGAAPGFALPEAERPADLDELAFADLRTLASLVRSRKVSSRELCETFLARLRTLDPVLHCVISYPDERALARADELDAMLAAGRWLGPLHGIPFGAKDLMAARGAKTTWGAKPFAEQVIDEDAAVIENLERRGAVLVAKLTLGALAMGDVWFGGTTRNPWNPERGSSGSSAGSASATAAGALPFAIGSETLGSILSPARVCGCTGLRPTFGVVDTRGAMALSWSMDKLGPLCRSADDAAIVFLAMLDRATREQLYPDGVPEIDVGTLRVGFVEDGLGRGEGGDGGVLDELRALGVEPFPVTLPALPSRAIGLVLQCEASAAFDELTRSGRDDELVRQDPRAWPNTFRIHRLVPAVEYLQAQRHRTLLMRAVEEAMRGVDVLVHASHHELATWNLTGHPTVIAPRGEGRGGGPGAIAFTGQLYGEAALLALARAWQRSTDHHRRHPEPK